MLSRTKAADAGAARGALTAWIDMVKRTAPGLHRGNPGAGRDESVEILQPGGFNA